MAEETERQRWRRNFADLLQELRVAQTGVQILFAFLLILPFSAQFTRTTSVQRHVYVLALLTAAAATALIISPVALHRALFRRGRKPELVRLAHWMASVGLAFLLVSMVSSVFLITDFLLERSTALIISAVIAAWFLTWWGAVPLARRLLGEEEEEDEEGGEGFAVNGS